MKSAIAGFVILFLGIRLAGWVLLDDFTWGMALFGTLLMGVHGLMSTPEKPSWPSDPKDPTLN